MARSGAAQRAIGSGGSFLRSTDDPACELLSGRGARAFTMFDSDCRSQFVNLTRIDVCFAHEVCKRGGNGIQFALDGLVAAPLGVLEHGNQHNDDDRHDRRTGSKPCFRETGQHPKHNPDEQTRDAGDEERSTAYGMCRYSCNLVEARSLPVYRAWRGCRRLFAYLELSVFILHKGPLPADLS
jgi:hypothetical protein